MTREIQRAAVIGAGVMGGAIAAHLSNVGIPVLLMDVPGDGDDRDAVARRGLDRALGASPALFYDKRSARLIDIELVHEKSLTTLARQADDLLVFLLDLLALGPDSQWLALALAFLNAYGRAAVIAQLKNQLALPSGMAWIWWGVRTSFASNPVKLKKRLDKLRDVAGHLGYYRAFAARRLRQKRRASSSCQVTSAGMPRPISRARQTNESANAPSPEMPSKLPITK